VTAVTKATAAMAGRRGGKLRQLEAVRGFAAAYVFFGHCLLNRLFDKSTLGHWSYLLRASQEAVMAFFLLSGFVIFYSVAAKPAMGFTDYARARILRIIPLFTLALLLAVCFCNNDLVTPAVGDRFQWVGALLFMADENTLKPGVWFSPFCGNGPLWTLTYEWWFYVLFWPIYRLVGESRQKYVVFALAVLGLAGYSAAPNQIFLILSYFPIWWLGVEFARAHLRGELSTWRGVRAPLALLAGMVVLRLAALPLSPIDDIRRGFGFHPLLEVRHTVSALVIAVAGLLWHRARWRYFDRLIGPFTVIAPISYALYILHYPIVGNAHFLDGIGSPLVAGTGYMLIALALAYAAEIWYQPRIVRLVGKVWPKAE